MGEETPTRRRVLQGVVGGVATGAGINWLLGEGTVSPLRGNEAPRVDDVGEPSPLREQETPYAVYQYASIAGEFASTLPINIVFPLEIANFDEIMDVFENAGWYHRPAEHVRYAYDRETGRWSRCHWSAAETVFGVGRRLHVRCWHLSDTASMQVHIDTIPRPGHQVYSFADAVRGVRYMFEGAGWNADESISLGNNQPPDHEGQAVVIRR